MNDANPSISVHSLHATYIIFLRLFPTAFLGLLLAGEGGRSCNGPVLTIKAIACAVKADEDSSSSGSGRKDDETNIHEKSVQI